MILTDVRYKKLTHWVQIEAPRLANDPAVIDTMHDLIGVPRAEARAALRWGQGPTIKIVRDLVCKSRAAGCFRAANPGQIEIEEQIVEAFQRGLEKDQSRSTGTRTVPRAGIVLLHELVHWADFKTNGGRTDVGAPYHDIASKWEWIVFATFLPEMAGD